MVLEREERKKQSSKGEERAERRGQKWYDEMRYDGVNALLWRRERVLGGDGLRRDF